MSIIFESHAQVWVNGEEYPFTGTSSGPNFDLGTPMFSYDAAPTLVGGVRLLARKGGYWYLYYTGVGITYGFTYFLMARTTAPQTDPNLLGPPDCAQWQLYSASMGSPGYFWTGYPTSTPPAPNGNVITYNISGTLVVSAGTGTSTVVQPEYLDLSTKTSSTIASYSNQAGRLLYNICDNVMVYNNGSAWKQVWPHNGDYPVNLNQKFNFGSLNTSIFSRSVFSNPDQLVLKSNNIDRVVLEKDNYSTYSKINLKGSVGVSVFIVFAGHAINDENYAVIYKGPGGDLITLPNPSTSTGRILVIANTSSGVLNFTPTMVNAGSSINANQSVQIISDGTNWIKIN